MSLLARLRGWNRERLARRHAGARALEERARNETAILESLVFLLRAVGDDRRARAQAEQAAAERQAAMERRLGDALADLSRRAAELEERLLCSAIGKRAATLSEPTRRPDLLNPEADLLAHLAPALPHRTALDVGANVGDVSAVLLDAGLSVHAFEPAPATFQALARRLAGRPGFVAHPVALGKVDGTAQLHLARDDSGGRYGDPSLYASLVSHAMLPDLQFGSAVTVPVRSLESLHRAAEIPAEIGIVKIDTEGLDLEVIRGMGERTYPVVVAEFWDPESEFGRNGAHNRLDALVGEMRRRGYPWHLVLYRVWGREGVAWYCNRSASVERSWGNVLFFRDRELFGSALGWCSAALPQARFVEAPRAPVGGA